MLPKISHALTELTIPSSKKKIHVRRMLVKDEKVLLMAKEDEAPNAVLGAVRQVVNNCIVAKNFDIDKLTLFDLDYLFIQIRSISMNNIVELEYYDEEDQHTYNFEIHLDKLAVEFPKDITNTIHIGDDTAIVMKYPTVALYNDPDFVKADGQKLIDKIVVSCVDKVIKGDESYDIKNYTLEDVNEFFDNLDIVSAQNVTNFMSSMPKIQHKIEYTNLKGTKRTHVLSSLNDFFMLY